MSCAASADGTLVIVRSDAREAVPGIGESVHLAADADAAHVFDPASGDRIDAESETPA